MQVISKKVILFLRILIALFAYGFIAYRLNQFGWEKSVSAFTSIFQISNLWYIVFVVVLMPFAWFLEALKWRISLRNIEVIKLITAFKSVWYGVVAGQLTPNRIGEPLGRIAMISPDKRGKALIYSMWCGFTQQTATLIFGILGLIYWSFNFEKNPFLNFNPTIIILSFICLLAVFLVLSFKINWITKVIQRIGLLKKALAGESIEVDHSYVITLIVLGISIIRYFVFSTQFCLLIFMWEPKSEIFTIYSAIFLTYLFTSFIPSYALSEAGVRAGVALVFLGVITTNSFAIMSSSIMIWILNVGFPALIAAWFPWFHSELKY